MKILLLGSTGSIGASACACIRRHPGRFSLAGLAANRNADTLIRQIEAFSPRWVYVASPDAADKVRPALPSSTTLFEGPAGLTGIVEEADYDVLLNALVGAVGFAPTVTALKRNKRVALANKESLVIGGDVITRLLDQGHGELIPVDSEHSAILQCITGETRESVERIVLTASGGPFRELPSDQFAAITPAQALDHPTWSMGNKITIDAGTLMNKGFEVIEAHHLFRLPYDRLRVVVHPQSIVHSMVVFRDGAVMAQCGVPDMELPIQYALSYPERLPLDSRRLDLAAVGALTFFEPDVEKFRCLKLCIEAGRAGGTHPAVLNAANEIAVASFLEGSVRFDQIPAIVERALESHEAGRADSVEAVLEADRRTRADVLATLQEKQRA
ncbi:MAG: 1-deoxy-D-xylulose-5-phosphate reductoisomerase [Chitinivibrionales bacterium]|nr:1-deoxy-D-xylulose-5-phosphate reductoisomerase [Chitinivibrionales bacterium]MBD3394527.1 1-deoxy-D-xylulose-5-phosphate reductoisomerase [Chitinivibrionales bacterium]